MAILTMTKAPGPAKTMNRQACLEQMGSASQQFDILVIGGGASGLGIALDAVSRGYKTILLEQSDFAKGTSSRSTKLIHGGVRYLAQGNISLVREASIERGILYRNAPHLVKKQSFLIPVYSYLDRAKYTIGLKFYDSIAGKLRLGSSKFISREETIRLLPNIDPENLKGGVLYHDGQFDDSRLAINLVQSLWEHGGYAINYMKVTGLQKAEGGKITGVTAVDVQTGKEYRIDAKAVVNATGVFVDDILQMDKPGSAKTICVSQGIHLVLDKKFFPSPYALMIPKTSDGRVLFAVPWHDKVILGTTDTQVDEASLEPQALEKEIAFILETASAYFLQKPERKDVLSVFAGQRPLAAPKNGQQKTKEISRSHKIIISPSGLFTILGGKWTTYRKMGQDMVNRVERELNWKHRSTTTGEMHIHGYIEKVNWSNPLYYYGSDEALIRERMNGTANKWISESLKIHKEQVIWAVKYEMAQTLEDVLSRRTRALLLDANESIRIAPEVARIMAAEMQKGEDWVNQQLNDYKLLAQQYTLKAHTR